MQAFIAGYCEISLIKSVSERRNYFEPGTDEYYKRRKITATQYRANRVRPFCAEPYGGCAMTLFLYREKPSEKHRDGKQVSSLRATTRIEGR